MVEASIGGIFNMALLEVASTIRGRRIAVWAIAISAFLVALSLRVALDRFLPPGFPFLTFFPAVILTALLAGLWPAIVCAGLSTLAAWYWFIAPAWSFAVSFEAAVALVFFIASTAIDIVVIEVMNRAIGRLRNEQALTARLYAQQRSMFQELQHRVSNNMAFVASLLSLHKRAAGRDPEKAIASLDDARMRVETFARIHRRLYDPAAMELPVGQFLQELCTDMLTATGARNIVCLVEAVDLTLDFRKLSTLSLVITEVMTNSLKHAFAGRENGMITIRLARTDSGSISVEIRDDGPGFPEDFRSGPNSLGIRIVQGFVQQLEGEIDYVNDNGAVARLKFPA
jgi:two-component sensor histidine kinase